MLKLVKAPGERGAVSRQRGNGVGEIDVRFDRLAHVAHHSPGAPINVSMLFPGCRSRLNKSTLA
jgi:hypothetical protein